MTSPLSRSIAMKLSSLAKDQGIAFDRLQTIFYIERMLERFLTSPILLRALVFKGGFVQNRVYGSPRFTIDLDAVLKGQHLSGAETPLIEAIEGNLEDGVWFLFEEKRELELQNDYGGVRFTFRVGLGKERGVAGIAQRINFDLGIGDVVSCAKAETRTLLGGKQISWSVYPPEFMVAEKLHAALSRALENSRSKDIFDLYFLLPKCNPDATQRAIVATFQNRGAELPNDVVAAFQNISTHRLKRGWIKAVSGIRNGPDFEVCIAEILDELRRIYPR